MRSPQEKEREEERKSKTLYDKHLNYKNDRRVLTHTHTLTHRYTHPIVIAQRVE